MSRSRHKTQIVAARRQRMRDHLVAYMTEHPHTVPPEIGEAFLRYGRAPEELEEMMANQQRYNPQGLCGGPSKEIRAMGAAIYNQHNAERLERVRRIEARDKKRGQKIARRLTRGPK